eukprot:SAG25_NODE_11027_length_315_cov_1.703704_1_plen_90_part_10
MFLPLVDSCGNVLSQFLELEAQQSLVAQCQASQSLVAGGAGSSYQCACVGGWTGAHCDTNDPCAGVSCSGHGSCTVTDRGGHECACSPGY